jgi:hypothetical protein
LNDTVDEVADLWRKADPEATGYFQREAHVSDETLISQINDEEQEIARIEAEIQRLRGVDDQGEMLDGGAGGGVGGPSATAAPAEEEKAEEEDNDDDEENDENSDSSDWSDSGDDDDEDDEDESLEVKNHELIMAGKKFLLTHVVRKDALSRQLFRQKVYTFYNDPSVKTITFWNYALGRIKSTSASAQGAGKRAIEYLQAPASARELMAKQMALVQSSGEAKTESKADSLSVLQSRVLYFEVTVVSEGHNSSGNTKTAVAIGMCDGEFGLTQAPGAMKGSFGFSGASGIFKNGDTAAKKGAKAAVPELIKSGTVLGCGLDVLNKKAFFTRNGKRFGQIYDVSIESRDYFACVACSVEDAVMRVNYGQKPFMFSNNRGGQKDEEVESLQHRYVCVCVCVCVYIYIFT